LIGVRLRNSEDNYSISVSGTKPGEDCIRYRNGKCYGGWIFLQLKEEQSLCERYVAARWHEKQDQALLHQNTKREKKD
jgi:hypothetical protein